MPLRGTAGEKKARKWKPAKDQNQPQRTRRAPAPIDPFRGARFVNRFEGRSINEFLFHEILAPSGILPPGDKDIQNPAYMYVLCG